jgi:dipeptidyl aminopeptidase/acylaminoacyl peptidase
MIDQRLAFSSDGRQLEAALRLPEAAGPAPCVVLCHGFGSYDDDLDGFVRLAEFLARAGMASLRFSFRGSHPYADQGDIRPASGWIDDALAAVAFAAQQPGIDAARMGLLGVSVGGGVVIQAAALCRAVRAVVALAPVADGGDWLRHRWLMARGQAAWEEFVAQVEADQSSVVLGRTSRRVRHFDVQALPDEGAWDRLRARFPRVLAELTLASVWDTFHFKPLYYAHAVGQPLCLIHGDADESVPLEHSRQVYERAGGTKTLQVLPGAPHCPWETAYEGQVQQLALQWFEQWLPHGPQ